MILEAVELYRVHFRTLKPWRNSVSNIRNGKSWVSITTLATSEVKPTFGSPSAGKKKPSGFIISDDGKGRCKDDPDWVRRRPPAAAPMNPKRQATSTHHAMKMRVLPSSAIATVNSTSVMMKITDARCCCAELVLVSTICTFLEKLSLNGEGGGKLGARAPY